MTNITGKIYQMKNADGTENRFPRTVIEAVLGLSSYLQDQFSSLADIYMPIEGIYEALTGQEFVFRKSPNTIKAKSLTIDRIKGKTLAWNQICGRTLTSGELNGITYTYNPATGAIVFSGTATANTNIAISTINVIKFIAGHKYIFLGLPSSGGSYGSGWAFRNNSTSVVVEENGKILTYPSSGTPDTIFSIRIASGVAINNTFNPTVTDLTLLYGSEIDGLTNEQILAKYEADFGTGYHPFAQKLISNDAEAVETTGVNQWDEEWESGYLDQTTGEPIYGGGKRAKNFISVFPSTTYYGKNIATGMRIFEYDANKNFLTCDMVVINETFVTGNKTCFIKFQDGTPSYAYDICINLSNPAINGQYFPYWKRTLNLGLNNLKVKSHNIWDEEWEIGGIKDADGLNNTETNRIRSKNYIPVIGGATYYFRIPSPYSEKLFYYDANKNYLGNSGGFNTARDEVIPSGVAFIRFSTSATYGTTYNHDICINLSSSFNGQYEHYGDITINGLKSAGSVYDEIVGNKYIKRVGSVDLGRDLDWSYNSSWSGTDAFNVKIANAKSATINIICAKYTRGVFGASTVTRMFFSATQFCIVDTFFNGNIVAFKDAMSGVMLYYELATPIEYDLVEPLIYTTKAGTTEERISPNSDGLSAPFCCDMTYSANENNDAGNAQYAATAGRLLNTRKIWGQDFNGSEDVDGNLVANGTIQGTQLKSTVATGTAPLTVASTTLVNNLNVEKVGGKTLAEILASDITGNAATATKLRTAVTIWGRSFDGSGNVSGALENVTTISASGLATISGGVALGTSAKAQAARLVWDETNNAWHLQGNLYVDGFVTAGGINNQE